MLKFIRKIFNTWKKCEQPEWFDTKVLEKKMPKILYFQSKTSYYKAIYNPDYNDFKNSGGHWSIYDYVFYRKKKI